MNEAKDYVKNKIDKQTRTQYEYTLNRIIFLAKKEVFDDIEDWNNDLSTWEHINKLKKKHLTPTTEKAEE